MQYTVNVTSKGQATIPVSIRRKLGIKPNDKVSYEIDEKNQVKLKAVPDLLSLKGSLKSDKPFDIDAMDKAVEEYVVKKYVKKHNRY